MSRWFHSRLGGFAAAGCVFVLSAALIASESFAQTWKIISPDQPVTSSEFHPKAPTASIEGLRVLPDQLGQDTNGLVRYGLRLEVSFTVRNFAGKMGRVDIFFRLPGEGFLTGAYGSYASVEGYVSVRRSFQSLTNRDKFESVGLFIPREELQLARGDYTMQAVVLVRTPQHLLSRAVFAFPYHHDTSKLLDATEEP